MCLLLFFCVNIQAQASSAANIQTVDSLTGSGLLLSSLALDSGGKPNIVYSDSSNLKFARLIGSSWHIQSITDGGYIDQDSLVLDANDYSRIAFYDPKTGDLKYAGWSGAEWSFQTVGSAGDEASHIGGGSPSIALDSQGIPYISYFDSANKILKFAKWVDSGWDIQTVDSGVVPFSSLALDNNNVPHISYIENTNGSLKYASYTNLGWDIQTIDPTGDFGLSNSLVLDSEGNPHICYQNDYVNGNLIYVQNIGEQWEFVTLPIQDTFGASSLALDSNGNPYIAYLVEINAETFNVQYIRRSGSEWITQNVTSISGGAAYPSIAVDSNDNLHVSYSDGLNLKVFSANSSSSQTPLPEPTGTLSPSPTSAPTRPTTVDIAMISIIIAFLGLMFGSGWVGRFWKWWKGRQK